MEYDPITVAETGAFQRKAGRLLSENEKAELLTYLAMHPNAGAIIKGTGGIRKLRWAREGMGKSGGVRVMGKAFEEINAGLEDAIRHARGQRTQVLVHKPETIDVKAIREKTGMSQQRFCATFGISLGTLRHWEQGLRAPRGPARVLLKVVDNDPQAVIRAVGN